MSTTKEQAIYVLNTLSNVNAGKFCFTEAELQANADKVKPFLAATNDTTNFLGGTWDVVWGPALTNEPETVKVKVSGLDSIETHDDPAKEELKATKTVHGFATTNAMFVAKGKLPGDTEESYVVAVAGTNVDSMNGWFAEDFQVGVQVAWPPSYLGLAAESAGNISAGTSLGVYNLWTKPDPTTGKKLYDFFLEEIPANGSANIVVCGHSLGGALSPCVATALAEQSYPQRTVKISAYPTAGPTPGDSAFAGHVISTLGATNFHPTVNTHDIVPHAWQQNGDMGMDKLGGIYSSMGITETPVIQQFLKWAEKQKGSKDYLRIGTDSKFTGDLVKVDRAKIVTQLQKVFSSWNFKDIAIKMAFKSIYGSATNEKNPSNADVISATADFMVYAIEAGIQHTSAYSSEKGFNFPQKVKTSIGTLIDMKNLSPYAEAEVEDIVTRLVEAVVQV